MQSRQQNDLVTPFLNTVQTRFPEDRKFAHALEQYSMGQKSLARHFMDAVATDTGHAVFSAKIGDAKTTALNLAIATPETHDIARAVIDRMTPRQLGIADGHGLTALHLAASSGHEDIALRLIGKMSCVQVAKMEEDGRGPFALAATLPIRKAIAEKLAPCAPLPAFPCPTRYAFWI